MELIHRHYANATFSSINKSYQINSLENLASKQRIHQIVKEQHGFMLTVRSKDRSVRLAPTERSPHRTCVLSRRTAAPACRPRKRAGGASRDRTGDLLLAKQALSQLSYGPLVRVVGLGGVAPPTSPLSGVRSN